MPDGFCTFRIADRIIIQFDLPAGCRKHIMFPQMPPGGTNTRKAKLNSTIGFVNFFSWDANGCMQNVWSPA